MAKNKQRQPIRPFTHEEFLVAQLEILKAFEKKFNALFVEAVANKKKTNRKILLEMMSLMREVTSWYIRINSAMLRQNKAGVSEKQNSN